MCPLDFGPPKKPRLLRNRGSYDGYIDRNWKCMESLAFALCMLSLSDDKKPLNLLKSGPWKKLTVVAC